jgi:WD40 repeat protein
MPYRLEGSNFLILKVDEWNIVCESVETNNTLAVPVTYIPPDLVPVALRVPSVVTAAPNASVTMIWGVTNRSAGAAWGYWVDEVYVSTDAVLDLNDGGLASRFEMNTVAAGGSYWRTNTVRVPAAPSGTYYLIFKADAFNYLYESDESNNVSVAVPVTYINLFPPPDLMPVALQVPAVVTGPPYPSVTLVWGVTNRSAGPAWGYWHDKLYVSTNAVLDGTATSVGVWSETNTVAAGGSYWRTNTVWVPVVQSGTYYLIVVTDSDGDLYESAETNNRLAVQVTIVVTNPPGSQFRILAATGSRGAHPFSLVELRVNPAAEVLIGPSDFYTALDFSPEGELYAAGSELHILNPTNGTVKRVVGTLRTAQASSLSVDSIAFSPDGRLYAVAYDLTDDVEVLYQVDPATAFATEIGPIEGEYVWGIDFAPDGTLYGAEFDLVVLDPATGRVVSKIGRLAGSGVVDIDYAPDGAIYGVDYSSRQLYRINPSNAATLVVGTYESDLRGVASQPSASAAPLIMLPPKRGTPTGVEVCWSSVPGKLYSLERSTNLAISPAFLVFRPNVSGQANRTCITDLTATNVGPYFYRVRVEP